MQSDKQPALWGPDPADRKPDDALAQRSPSHPRASHSYVDFGNGFTAADRVTDPQSLEPPGPQPHCAMDITQQERSDCPCSSAPPTRTPRGNDFGNDVPHAPANQYQPAVPSMPLLGENLFANCAVQTAAVLDLALGPLPGPTFHSDELDPRGPPSLAHAISEGPCPPPGNEIPSFGRGMSDNALSREKQVTARKSPGWAGTRADGGINE